MILTPPQANTIGVFGLQIHYYSICIFFAILVGLFVAVFACKKFKSGASEDLVLDFAPGLIIFSILGARLYYVLLSFRHFFRNPLEAFMIWNGGISIHGAFIAGVIFGIWYFKKRGLNFFTYADIFCLALPLGQAIGRFGNFFNSEAFGIPVGENAPFALFVNKAFRPVQYADYDYFCPVFLYESILDFLIFISLFALMSKISKKYAIMTAKPRYYPHGAIFFTYILLYSIVRAVLEFLRLDTVLFVWKIPFPALISFIGIFIGIAGILTLLTRNEAKSGKK